MKRNYKKLIVSVLTLAMVFTLNACGNKNSPENTVDELFESAKDLDTKKLSTLVVQDVQSNFEEDVNNLKEDFIDVDEDESINYKEIEGYEDLQNNLKEIQSNLSYKITNTEEMEDTAIVTVDVEYVDAQELIKETFGGLFSEIMTQAFAGDEELSEKESAALLVNTFNTSYNNFEKVLKKNSVDIQLIKTDKDEWLVSELHHDLINVLTFNMIDGIDNMFNDTFDGLEDQFNE